MSTQGPLTPPPPKLVTHKLVNLLGIQCRMLTRAIFIQAPKPWLRSHEAVYCGLKVAVIIRTQFFKQWVFITFDLAVNYIAVVCYHFKESFSNSFL